MRVRISVHPHVRGDYPTLTDYRGEAWGPSPRAWGLPLAVLQRHGHEGSIPTCVGTTARRCGRRPTARSIPTCVGTTAHEEDGMTHVAVHPHVRGDYDVGRGHRLPSYGPSPRAWGLHRTPASSVSGCGSIPTCVGTTWTLSGFLSRLRSIPTCVGTTAIAAVSAIRPPVHPHVRGDYNCRSTSSSGISGPSPRAWGLLIGPRSPTGWRRSIPTCVGTTQQI